MSVFVDTSALVKLYVPESGHDVIRAVDEPLVVARLTRVELPAALWGKQRQGYLAAEDAAELVAAFEADYYGTGGSEPRFTKVQLDDGVLAGAARLVARLSLRAGDAVQLASAVTAKAAARTVLRFASFDARLRLAAAIEGFALVPAELDA